MLEGRRNWESFLRDMGSKNLILYNCFCRCNVITDDGEEICLVASSKEDRDIIEKSYNTWAKVLESYYTHSNLTCSDWIIEDYELYDITIVYGEKKETHSLHSKELKELLLNVRNRCITNNWIGFSKNSAGYEHFYNLNKADKFFFTKSSNKVSFLYED